MSWQSKVLGLVKKYGASAKFAASTILNAVIPGSPAVIALVEKAFDSAQKTAQDDWEIGVRDQLEATADGQAKLEKMLDVLGGDLQYVFAQMAQFQHQPEVARQILAVVQANDARWQEAAKLLDGIAHRFDRLEEQQQTIIIEQRQTAEIIHQIHAAVHSFQLDPAARSEIFRSSGSGGLLESFNLRRQDIVVPVSGSDSVVVAQDGSGQFRTITEAVAAAQPGAAIFIKKGRYVESIRVGKAIRLVGVGNRSDVQVVTDRDDTFRIDADRYDRIDFYNMTIRGGIDQNSHGICLEEGDLHIIGCDILAGSYCCIEVVGSKATFAAHSSYFHGGVVALHISSRRSSTVEHCVITGQSNMGVLVSYGGCRIRNCVIRDNECCVMVGHDEGSMAIIERCELGGSRRTVIAAQSDEQYALIDTRIS